MLIFGHESAQHYSFRLFSRGLFCICLFLLHTVPLSIQAEPSPFIIDQNIYHDSLNTYGFDLGPYLQYFVTSDEREEGQALPSPEQFVFKADTAFPINFEDQSYIWLYAKLINHTSDDIRLAMYFAVDNIQIYLRPQKTGIVESIRTGARAKSTACARLEIPCINPATWRGRVL